MDTYDIAHYTEIFDALIMHDGDLTLVNMILMKIAGESMDLLNCPASLQEAYKLVFPHD